MFHQLGSSTEKGNDLVSHLFRNLKKSLYATGFIGLLWPSVQFPLHLPYHHNHVTLVSTLVKLMFSSGGKTHSLEPSNLSNDLTDRRQTETYIGSFIL